MKVQTKTITLLKRFVVGINNPKLIMIYKSANEMPDFKVYIDGILCDYDLLKLVTPMEYKLEVAYPKKVKKVKVCIVENEKEIELWSYRNFILMRIIPKITNGIISVFHKIKLFFSVLFHYVGLLWKEHHLLVPFRLWRKYFYDFRVSLKQPSSYFYNPFRQIEYLEWLSKDKEKEEIKQLEYTPLISILIPVYNISGKLLSECLDSILNQSYGNFEVCLADDCSTNKETIATLKRYENKDSRIKVVYRSENGHISKATNSALEIATGEFVALVDNDDTLDKNALYENVLALNKNPKLDFLYSDEDKIDTYGKRLEPHFKPDYSPDTLLSLNYICHFSVIRKSIVDELGGFTVGMEGAQDYDLFLRVVEKTNHIYHIPKILYHWRMIPGSTAASMENKDYAFDKGKKALEATLSRRGIAGKVEVDPASTYYRIRYEYDEPKVSIIIPTRDYADVTERCLKSLFEHTTYQNYEVILVNNNSEKEETFALFEKYKNKYSNFKVFDANVDFNYSKINNMAVDVATGDVIVLLNNDTEIITPDWLSIMVGYAIQPHIGAVGAKLLYPDMTIQHAGVILGLGGVASHAYIGEQRHFLGAYGRVTVPYNYSAVTAACLVVEKKKFLEVNKLEEELTVAYNDIDFNVKLLEQGYYNVFLPQVEVLHHESKSRGTDTSSEKYKRFLKEQNYMYNKWEEKIRVDRFYNPNYSYKLWFVLDKN